MAIAKRDSDSTRMSGRLASWREDWQWLRTPLLAYVAVRAFVLLIQVVASLTTHTVRGGLGGWDGKWFVMAATHGWPSHLPMVHGHVAANPIAFFPLLPIMMWTISSATGLSAVGVGLFLSGLFGFTAVVAVGLVTREFAGEEKARRAALLFAVFPGTYVFGYIYSEGIVVTAVGFGLVALLRHRWLLAGLLGAIASAASPVGWAFAVSCAWCAAVALRRNRAWSSLAAPLIAPCGGFAWLVFLRVHTGTWNAWRLTERGGWNSYPSIRYPAHIVAQFVFDPIRPTLTGQILFIGTLCAIVGIVLAIRERQPIPVLLYGITAVLMAMLSAPVGLRPRFLMLAFPLVIAVATRYSGRIYRWLVALSSTLLIGLTVMALFSNSVFP